jgi:hypothetical protein
MLIFSLDAPSMLPKSILTLAFILTCLTCAVAQNTRDLVQEIDSIVTDANARIPKPRAGRTTYSFAVGTRSLFYPTEKYLDGTDRQYIKNINWIPMSFKAEFFLAKWYAMGVSINVINNQRIYDAMWRNYSTEKTEVHRFTIKQMRAAFLFRNNFYVVKKTKVEFYLGVGLGFAIRDQVKMVKPYAYEYGGSGETDFLNAVGTDLAFWWKVV